MEYSFEFGDGAWQVLVSTSGIGSLEGFLAMRAELFADPRFRPGLRVLFDHSALDLRGATADDVRSLAGSAPVPQFAGSRVAIVAPSAYQYGMTRMFQAHLGDTGNQELRVFAVRDEALAWLAEGGD